ncbi:MAG TPA: MoaD/ThiS family protein [Chthoniobacteraceae bacterium]|nr:MoaD/ThiS family protein [Chthoniobacteraceae bacterium]
MRIKILAFAQARDQLGFDEREIDCAPEHTAREIIHGLGPGASIETMRVAVDCEYRGWDDPVGDAKEIAIIPPVSGG